MAPKNHLNKFEREEMDWENGLIEFSSLLASLFWLFVGVYALIAVFEGTRNIFSQRINKKSIWLVAIGVIISIGFSVSSFSSASYLSKLSLEGEEMMLTESIDDFDRSLSPEELTERSKSLASLYFSSYGKMVSYFNLSGEKEMFCPSEQDVAKRDLTVETQCNVKHAASVHRSHAWNQLLYLLSAFLLGWMASKKYFKILFNESV